MDNKGLEKCPYCGGTDMVKGRQCGPARIFLVGSITSIHASEVIHIICSNCGTLVRSYVKNTEKFK